MQEMDLMYQKLGISSEVLAFGNKIEAQLSVSIILIKPRNTTS